MEPFWLITGVLIKLGEMNLKNELPEDIRFI